MRASDRAPFAELIAGVYEFYQRDLSEFSLQVWWTALEGYELQAIREALGRHSVNPDAGQFVPKPADVVKMLEGTTQDAALIAWTKLEQAIQRVGTYATVAFDDPMIHTIVEEMGGWIGLGKVTLTEWPFKQQEFVKRYRGYRARSEQPSYLPKLLGIIDAQNAAQGYATDGNVKLIGDEARARKVLAGGSERAGLAVTAAAALTDKRVAA